MSNESTIDDLRNLAARAYYIMLEHAKLAAWWKLSEAPKQLGANQQAIEIQSLVFATQTLKAQGRWVW